MKDSDSVEQFMGQVSNVVSQLRLLGETLPDQRVVEKVLRSMPKRFESVIVAIEESKDLSQISVEDLMGSLISHESRMNKYEESSLENAFKTQVSVSRGRGRKGKTGRGRGSRPNFHGEHKFDAEAEWEKKTQHNPHSFRGSSSRNVQQNAQKYDKSKVQCYYCKKFGHYANRCRKRQADAAIKQSANLIEEPQNSENSVLLTCNVVEESPKDVWFVDSGCSNHMTGNKELFGKLDSSIHTEVKLGNDSKVTVNGEGDVPIFDRSGKRRTVEDVYYVPGLKCNLISVGQLMDKDYEVRFKRKVCTILDNSPKKQLIARIEMTKNRMYPLCLKSSLTDVETAYKVNSQDQSWLWHLRYGHLHFGGLKMLHHKQMVRGLPSIEQPTSSCESCIMAKQHRDSFPSGVAYRAKSCLEIVHSDLCGSMQTPSLGGNLYFLSFIDDYSRKIWVYLLKQKSETFGIFKRFKAMVEKESGKRIKILRSDRGGEYKSNEFLEFCRINGIKRQFTTRYTPQQNGIAERKNRTIMDMVRSMLKEKHLGKEYWGEAVRCAVYILNRSLTKSLSNQVPEEAWNGRKCSVAHLRIFGCVAFAHIPDKIRKKLDDHSEKCIFVGYSDMSKAYRLYNPITKKMIISRDVKFKEEESWDGSVDNTIIGGVPFSYENDEGVEQIEQAGQPTPTAVIPIASTPRRQNAGVSTPQSRTPRTAMQGDSSRHADQQSSSSQLSSDSNPTLATMKSRIRGQKMRSLNDIYDQALDEEINQNVNFALIAYQPANFDEAVQDDVWIDAMDEEINAIEKNDTWELVDLPAEKDCIGVKWIYKTKLNADGEVVKHKARLVAQGFSQQPGIDYNETFAPVARLDTVRLVLAIAAQHSWKVHQMDVKSAFLNGFLEEEVYVKQPPGYEVKGEEGKVYKLKKALYGLKQAPRVWYSRIDAYLISNGFNRSGSEPTLYTQVNKHGEILILCLYVDDLIFTGNLSINDFKTTMKTEFEMTDLGLMKYFLGIEVKQSKKGIFISQSKYVFDVLKRFRMLNCKSAATPVATGTKLSRNDEGSGVDPTEFKRLVGSLMYLIATRLDILYAVSLISRFMEAPKASHWQVGKRILRYIAGTAEYGILYSSNSEFKLIGFTDSDFAGSQDDRKSTSGYVFNLGSGEIAWSSKKQQIVTLSSAEAEYVAATSAACQSVWMRRILSDLQHAQNQPTEIFCDNKSAIALSKNHVFHKRSKHIDTRFHFIRELVNGKQICLEFCKSNEQLADVFTKPLAKDVFEFHRQNLGVCKCV